MSQEHGVVGRNGAQLIVNRQSLDCRRRQRVPLRLMPAATEDPPAGLRLDRGRPNALNNLLPAAVVRKIQLGQTASQRQEVPMTLDETGRHECAIERKHCGLRTHEPPDLLRRSQGDDAPAAGRQGLDPRSPLVHCHDPAIEENQVRDLLRSRGHTLTCDRQSGRRQPDTMCEYTPRPNVAPGAHGPSLAAVRARPFKECAGSARGRCGSTAGGSPVGGRLP